MVVRSMSGIAALVDEPLEVVLDELVGREDLLSVLRVAPDGLVGGIEVEGVAPRPEALRLLVVGEGSGSGEDAVVLADREIPEWEHVRVMPAGGESDPRALDERLTLDLPRAESARRACGLL